MGPAEQRPGDPWGRFEGDGRFPPPAAGDIVEITPALAPPPLPPRRRRIVLPVLLFLATCASTFFVAGVGVQPGGIIVLRPFEGLAYSLAVMTILTAHELGHFFQALRHRVPASLPFFIPMPVPPIGTMGAVIGMRAHVGDRRALFDIAITGPLAGLVPALACCFWGLRLSKVVNLSDVQGGLQLGTPLLFQWISDWVIGPLPEGHDILLHPIAFAGWVGLFITALNLFPIGQLDGGHILYALLRRKAHPVAILVLAASVVGVVVMRYWGWSLMLFLLFMMGPRHPPTANDQAPLGPVRMALGWLALSFVAIGFTPMPFLF